MSCFNLSSAICLSKSCRSFCFSLAGDRWRFHHQNHWDFSSKTMQNWWISWDHGIPWGNSYGFARNGMLYQINPLILIPLFNWLILFKGKHQILINPRQKRLFHDKRLLSSIAEVSVPVPQDFFSGWVLHSHSRCFARRLSYKVHQLVLEIKGGALPIFATWPVMVNVVPYCPSTNIWLESNLSSHRLNKPETRSQVLFCNQWQGQASKPACPYSVTTFDHPDQVSTSKYCP